MNEQRTSSDARTDVEVIVIGGGQAGLAISYCLKERGIDHLVLERHRLGWAWREQRWDSFCLVTPNWQCRLPGFSYDGDDPDGFMVKQQILDYLERYADLVGPPLREGVEVNRVERGADGRFHLATSAGPFSAAQLVVATGNYHRPRRPALSERLPRRIHQCHSSDYRSSERLPDGEVLVVGSAQSGAQIAEDLHLAGRRVHLCVGSAPRVARFYRGRDVVAWLDDMGHYRLTVDDHPLGDAARRKTNHYVTGRDGGRDIDLRAFARQGMHLHGRLLDYRETADGEGELLTADDLAARLDSADASSEKIKDSIDEWIAAHGIGAPEEPCYRPLWQPPGGPGRLPLARLSSVVWATGFHTDFSWLAMPACDDSGYPLQRRGISPIYGLYFLGLPWLWTWGSGRFEGVGADAEFLAARIDLRRRLPAERKKHANALR